MERVLLFSFVADWIKITIEAYFDDAENLVIEGYDIGKRVEEAWGDSDYEYSTTVVPSEVSKIYSLFNLEQDKKKELLAYVQSHYHTNTCYSEIQTLFDQHNIKYQGFSWM